MRHPAGTIRPRHRFPRHRASVRVPLYDISNAVRRGNAGLAFILAGILAGLAIIVFPVIPSAGPGHRKSPSTWTCRAWNCPGRRRSPLSRRSSRWRPNGRNPLPPVRYQSIVSGSMKDRSPLVHERARSRHAEASGLRPRRSSIRFISPACERPAAAAIPSRTAQNSASRATEVAWPDSETERFFNIGEP